MNAVKTNMSRELIDIWIAFANENIEVAKALMIMDFKPYNPICFHAVTAGEKYLKLYLHNKGHNPGKTRDLLQMLKFCYNHDPSFETIVPAIIVLNSFTIAGIHPEELNSEIIEKEEALDAIRAAEEVQTFVKKIMNTDSK